MPELCQRGQNLRFWCLKEDEGNLRISPEREASTNHGAWSAAPLCHWGWVQEYSSNCLSYLCALAFGNLALECCL